MRDAARRGAGSSGCSHAASPRSPPRSPVTTLGEKEPTTDQARFAVSLRKSTPPPYAADRSASVSVPAGNRRLTTVASAPRVERPPFMSRFTRPAKYDVSGSTTARPRPPAGVTNAACARPVTASSTPTDQPLSVRPGQLGRAEDGRDVGQIGVDGAVGRAELRGTANASRVDDLRGSALGRAEDARAEAKDLRSLHEEGPLLGELGLERGEVHDGGIELDLARSRD
jgi:hypothetical protein